MDEDEFKLSSELVEASVSCLLARVGCILCCFAVVGAMLLMGWVSFKYSGGIIMGLMWLAESSLL